MIGINSKAQTWSIDVILGVILFLSAFFIFYSLLNQNFNKTDSLKQEASSVIKEVSSGDSLIRIVDNNELNITRIGMLKNISYDELKFKFRIEGDFCIYIEDEEGNLVIINNSYRSIGSPMINVSGVPCSQA